MEPIVWVVEEEYYVDGSCESEVLGVASSVDKIPDLIEKVGSDGEGCWYVAVPHEVDVGLELDGVEYPLFFSWKGEPLRRRPGPHEVENLPKTTYLEKPFERMGEKVEQGGSCFDIIDSEEQWLMVRVGPVFGPGGRYKEPGVWINYQEKHLESTFHGPVLFSMDTLRELMDFCEENYQLYKK